MTLIIFLCTAIFGRFVYLQIFSSDSLQAKAVDQWTRDVPITGERGDIRDVNGVLLADTATQYTVYVRPNSIQDKDAVAALLSAILHVDKENLSIRLHSKVSEITVSKKVSGEQIRQLYENGLTSGVYYAQNVARKYVYGDFLSMVIGFTNVDGVGQTGIESQYNRYLQGIDGKMLTETDLVGKELTNGNTYFIEGIKGGDVYLTVDYSIQKIVQNAVLDAYVTHKAKSTSCVMMNAKTGAVLAMAQYPSFDLNDLPRDDVAKLLDLSKNTLITNVYEPGSTFKVLTAALALESGKASTSTRCYCPGYRIVDGKRIKCWRTIGHGSQSFCEGVQNSCNCMFMDMALSVGKEDLYAGYKTFGIREKTGIDLSGEGIGLMIDYDLAKNVDLARMGFGQAIAVTAMELVTACCSVINGGELLVPYCVDRVVNNGKIVYKGEKQIKRRVISETTCKIMRETLESVVREGGGKNAQVPGYRIGGKTGTAQKYGENGAIAAGKYVATFMGFAPANDPEFILLFIVDEPSAGAYYGSVVAAPYASRIFSEVFTYKGIAPTDDIQKIVSFAMPDVTGMTIQEAHNLLQSMGLYYEYSVETVNGNTVKSQIPVAGASVTTQNVVYLSL